MRIAKVRDVKTPERGTPGSAGIDFFVPNNHSEVYLVQPQVGVLIPSGIKADVPDGFALIAMNKSGVSTKKNLQVGACVVDSDYQGEIHLHVFNYGDVPVHVYPGEKLMQMLLIPVDHCEVTVVEEDTLYLHASERGGGGFGSTGT